MDVDVRVFYTYIAMCLPLTVYLLFRIGENVCLCVRRGVPWRSTSSPPEHLCLLVKGSAFVPWQSSQVCAESTSLSVVTSVSHQNSSHPPPPPHSLSFTNPLSPTLHGEWVCSLSLFHQQTSLIISPRTQVHY